MDDRAHHLGGRGEGAAVNLHRQLRAAAPLCQHREPSVGRAAGLRDNALRDLLLEHERQARPQRWPGVFVALVARQPAYEQRGADIVGQVGEDGERLAPHQLGMVELERITFDNPELTGEGVAQFGQCGQAAPVHLDCGHAGTGTQQRAREPARTGAHLEHLPARKVTGNCRDPVEQMLVEQEILPQRLRCTEPVPSDDFAKRRELSHARPGWQRSRTPCGWRQSSPRDRRGSCPRYRRLCRDRGSCAQSADQA